MIKYLILLVMTFLSAFASYFLKKSTSGDSFLKVFLNLNFYIGGILYVIATSCNILLLQVFPYAIILPLGSITYIWTMIISRRLLKEKISGKKIAGVVLIGIGVIFIAVGR